MAVVDRDQKETMLWLMSDNHRVAAFLCDASGEMYPFLVKYRQEDMIEGM